MPVSVEPHVACSKTAGLFGREFGARSIAMPCPAGCAPILSKSRPAVAPTFRGQTTTRSPWRSRARYCATNGRTRRRGPSWKPSGRVPVGFRKARRRARRGRLGIHERRSRSRALKGRPDSQRLVRPALERLPFPRTPACSPQRGKSASTSPERCGVVVLRDSIAGKRPDSYGTEYQQFPESPEPHLRHAGQTHQILDDSFFNAEGAPYQPWATPKVLILDLMFR